MSFATDCTVYSVFAFQIQYLAFPLIEYLYFRIVYLYLNFSELFILSSWQH